MLPYDIVVVLTTLLLPPPDIGIMSPPDPPLNDVECDERDLVVGL